MKDLSNVELILEVEEGMNGSENDRASAELIRRFNALLMKDVDVEKAFRDIMEATPSWATVTPVLGNGWVGERYRK